MAQRSRPSAVRRRLALASLPLAVLVAGALAAAPSEAAATSTPHFRGIQQAVVTARASYEQARLRVDALSRQSEQVTANAEQAEATATRLRDRVAGESNGFFHAVADLVTPGESDLDRAAEAADNAEHARALAATVDRAVADAIADTEKARQALVAAEQRQLKLEARWSAQQYAAAAIKHARFQKTYAVADPAQDARNRAALADWEAYLHELAATSVVPPSAADLADPDKLAAPLRPVRDRVNVAVPGVAEVDPADRPAVPVVPTETVRAISEAFHRVGLRTVPGGIDPTTYACGGLLANAWGGSRALPADAVSQFTDLRKVSPDTLQLGDVVVLGTKRDGLAQTAVYVGHRRIIVADPATGTAGVQALPAAPIGVRRATLAPAGDAPTPPTGGLCGPAAPAPVVSGDGPLALPVSAGYTLSAGFGEGGGLWSSGEHTGQDFADPIGTPAYAAGDGTVTVQHPGWAGNLVRIDHGGGVETLYAHLSRVDVTTGQTVKAGDQVGLVGTEGNSTGPHLHFEVRLDGSPVDPLQVLTVPEAPPATYENGAIPDTALCTATPDGAQLLRCDAAVAFRLMAAAYADDTGSSLCITDSYRSRDEQERAHVAKPTLTAEPGTSNHGRGVAVDLCGGIERFDTPEHQWMVKHGPAFGWNHPSWADAGGSRPEPWHFEYGA